MGLAVAFVADPLSSLTGLTSAQEYSMGAFFVLYGLAVFSLAALPNLRRAGIGVVVANIVYTVAAIVAAEAGAHDRDRGRRDAGQRCVHRGVRRTAVPGSAPTRGVASLPAGAGRHRCCAERCPAPAFRGLVPALELAQAEPVDGVVGVLAQHQGRARPGRQNVLDQVGPVDRAPDLACGDDGLRVGQGRVVVEV